MAEISIGLGIVLSLLLSETLGVTAGGIIVPGYISLYLHHPLQVLATFLVAILVWGIIQGMGKITFLYGKRRIVLALILGFFFGYISAISDCFNSSRLKMTKRLIFIPELIILDTKALPKLPVPPVIKIFL